MFKMGPFQTEWVDSLTEFNQTDGVLKDENGHCCLGVACEVLGSRIGVRLESFIDDYDDRFYKAVTDDDQSQELLPGNVWENLGLRSPSGSINYDECQEALEYFGDNDEESSLADMNDDGYTFIQIQEFIRKYPQAVFTRSV